MFEVIFICYTLRTVLMLYLKARLKPINAWQNSDVVLLIKDIVSGPIFLISILSRHIANYLTSVSIPKLFPECFNLLSHNSNKMSRKSSPEDKDRRERLRRLEERIQDNRLV